MLRKCKAGAVPRPALFHGWFQYGNSGDGMDAMGVVEFEDGTTDYFSAGYITFDAPPTADIAEGAKFKAHNSSSPKCGECGSDTITITCGKCHQVRQFGTWSSPHIGR